METVATSATCNTCRLCAPLGASLALSGVQGAVTILHGSQGCATYIRRYMISHYKEPMDIASSSFDEASAVFGGRRNLFAGLENVIHQYSPAVIGVATTCLAETIGEDVKMLLDEFRREHAAWPLPRMVHVSTPSYSASHAEGYASTVRAIAGQLSEGGEREEGLINLLPGMVSPADLRHLRRICADCGLRVNLLPDYSDPLDGPAWEQWQPRPQGGTPLTEIRALGRAATTVELGVNAGKDGSAGELLRERYQVPLTALNLPIGLRATDALFEALTAAGGRPMPADYEADRGRLVDSYVDSHKYVSGARAVVYGEEALVVGLCSLLAEVGVAPVLCATSSKSGSLRARLAEVGVRNVDSVTVMEDTDFAHVEEAAAELKPDLLLGSSKGYPLARRLGVPLVRLGFPIHDRVGGARVLHVGYAGAHQLFDRIVNALIQARQDRSPVGYFYM